MTTHSSHSSYKAGITVLLGESGEVQQPVQDVAFVMSGQPDSLGQIESGQEITLEVVGFRVSSECTLESPRTTEEPCRELQCLNRLWS